VTDRLTLFFPFGSGGQIRFRLEYLTVESIHTRTRFFSPITIANQVDNEDSTKQNNTIMSDTPVRMSSPCLTFAPRSCGFIVSQNPYTNRPRNVIANVVTVIRHNPVAT